MIGWVIGIILTLFNILGFIFLVKGIKKITMDSNLKQVLIFMAISSILVIMYTTILFIFGLINLDIMSMFWISIPISYILVKLLWLPATYKLMQIMTNTGGKENG